MIGMGIDYFKPEKPHDFTIGHLSPVTVYSRKTKEIMVGLGYQEMIFNYLGSKKDYIDRMNIDASNVIEIANPMSENYQSVRRLSRLFSEQKAVRQTQYSRTRFLKSAKLPIFALKKIPVQKQSRASDFSPQLTTLTLTTWQAKFLQCSISSTINTK